MCLSPSHSRHVYSCKRAEPWFDGVIIEPLLLRAHIALHYLNLHLLTARISLNLIWSGSAWISPAGRPVSVSALPISCLFQLGIFHTDVNSGRASIRVYSGGSEYSFWCLLILLLLLFTIIIVFTPKTLALHPVFLAFQCFTTFFSSSCQNQLFLLPQRPPLIKQCCRSNWSLLWNNYENKLLWNNVIT